MKKFTSCGFTLIEVLVTMVIVGIMVAMAPRVFRREPKKNIYYVKSHLDRLVDLARQDAIVKGTVHRIVFTFKNVTLQKEDFDKERPHLRTFNPYKSVYLNTSYDFPSFVELRAVFLGRKEMLEEGGGSAFVYVETDGMVQPAFVQLSLNKNGVENRYTFKLQPFLGKFEIIEGWVKE